MTVTTEFAREAAEFALAHGIVRYTKEGAVTHLPFSLTPWQAEKEFVDKTRRLTPLFNELYHRVAQDDAYLESTLKEAVAADEFLGRLAEAKTHELAGKPCLYLNRNDCMPSSTGPKQVEMNLMASALGEGSAAVYEMHNFLFRNEAWVGDLVENKAGEGLAWALAEGYKQLNLDGVVLFLVPFGEVNVFDQRILQVRLQRTFGVPTAKATLEELGDEGEVRNGKLYFRGQKVAIAYFRTGYAPPHYRTESAWVARQKIEATETISVPSARTQLANTKMMQLHLALPGEMQRFMSAEEAAFLDSGNVKFARLHDQLTWKGQTGTAWELAREMHDDWVLKPHREGGGNNFFGDELVELLPKVVAESADAYILMEKIRQPSFSSIRLVDHKVIPCECFTEMGFFGLALYPEASGQAAFNKEQGYLLRTKDESMNEGLVLGGYSFLDVARTS